MLFRSSGFVAGVNCCSDEKLIFSPQTMIGSLAEYISTPNDKFQPMNANYGILPKLDEKVKDKVERYQKLADRALNCISFT